jgi:gliding motility-associated-like protein
MIGGTGYYDKYSWKSTGGELDSSISSSRTLGINVTGTQGVKYIFLGTTPEGCIESDSVVITAASGVVAAGGISPNGDGVNDKWFIKNADLHPRILVEVFNRWGQKVYSQRGYNNADKVFKGKLDGKELPIGTYYYVITIPNYSVQTGTITIMR